MIIPSFTIRFVLFPLSAAVLAAAGALDVNVIGAALLALGIASIFTIVDIAILGPLMIEFHATPLVTLVLDVALKSVALFIVLSLSLVGFGIPVPDYPIAVPYAIALGLGACFEQIVGEIQRQSKYSKP